jgi:hypothetical protein
VTEPPDEGTRPAAAEGRPYPGSGLGFRTRLTLGLVAAACETPAPTSVAPAQVERVYSSADAPAGLQAARLTPREAISRYFPDVLTRGTQGGNLLTFVMDHEGNVVHTSMEKRETFVAARSGEGAAGGSGVTAADGARTRFRLSGAGRIDVEPEQIEAVDILKFPAGKMGPDAVDVIWIRKRDPALPPRPVRVRGGSPEAGEAAARVIVRGEEGSVALRETAETGGTTADAPDRELRVEGVRLAPSAPDAGGAAHAGRGAAVRMSVRGDGTTTTSPATAAGPAVPAVDPAEVVRAIEQHHPEVVRGRATPDLWFVVGPDGRVIRTGSAGSMQLREYAPDDLLAVDVFKGDRIQVAGRGINVIWIRTRG